ncbi:type IV pilus modification PilV family protein [Oceanobacillus chungangensis]|uniref:type IV pilus modification PilV family protein n=1 Tax=Oceanobacillus chungangensis TaxID=1229152 RepID=UPI001474847A|nr:prepilin-type N-terminal cleavage/methylation domain-containing protein [Oceanobacillus chungangensis]
MRSKVQKSLTDETGFTLVEVLASLTILSIILVGVFNLFIFTNEAAVSNNDRLVAINLGQATMERVKHNPSAYFDNSSANSALTEVGKTYTAANCEKNNCESLYEVLINDNTYHISLTVSQNSDETKLKLIDVIVTVELKGKANHKVEGYITYVE